MAGTRESVVDRLVVQADDAYTLPSCKCDIVGLDPIGALAFLALWRVYASSGDKAKAKAAYQAFLALWKDADPAIPILKSAKAEYARL